MTISKHSEDHFPWTSWDHNSASSAMSDWLIDAKTLTNGSRNSLSSIDSKLFKSALLKHCMGNFGFFVVRNINFDKSTTQDVSRELMTLFQGNLELFPQERSGSLVLELSSGNSSSQPAIPFHTDAGHFLGLLCMENEAEGGESVLVSTLSIHDLMKLKDPVLLNELSKPWRFHRNNRPGPKYYEWPIYRHSLDFGLSCYFLPNTIRNTQSICQTKLTQNQIAALELFESISEINALKLQFKLQAGDFLILNNKKLLHKRNAYTLNSLNVSRRLLRVWINLPKSELADSSSAY